MSHSDRVSMYEDMRDILEYNHSTKMLDYDATTKTGESVEIKCEQFNGEKRLAGSSAWGTSPSTLVKLKKDSLRIEKKYNLILFKLLILTFF